MTMHYSTPGDPEHASCGRRVRLGRVWAVRVVNLVTCRNCLATVKFRAAAVEAALASSEGAAPLDHFPDGREM